MYKTVHCKFSYILLILDESYTVLILCVCWFLPFQSLASGSVCMLQVHLRFVWQFDYHNTKPRDMQLISIFHREIPIRHHLGTLREPKKEFYLKFSSWRSVNGARWYTLKRPLDGNHLLFQQMIELYFDEISDLGKNFTKIARWRFRIVPVRLVQCVARVK